MKKTIVAIMIILGTISACFLVQAVPPTPMESYVRLPTRFVTMNAVYGIDSWFDMKLSNVPVGYDIRDGAFHGWCIQKSIYMTQGVNHAVVLYSSLDPDLLEEFQDDDWDKVNYVINHKLGDRSDVQKVIWYYICEDSMPSEIDAQEMIKDADLNGEGYVPGSGEYLAIPVSGVPAIQATFLEFPLRFLDPIGDLVWNDLDHDGIQDKGEPGLTDVSVKLYDENNNLISSTKTDISGHYSFNNPPSVGCYIKFVLPVDYVFSPRDAGVDDNFDSDANTISGKTSVIHITEGSVDSSWDAGMYYKKDEQPPSGGNPSIPSYVPVILNNAPTADATNGAPYKGVVGVPIVFDGSRSYDIDGYIMHYKWDFGDGLYGSGEIVNHTYEYAAYYPVILTVTDNDGATDTYKTKVNVQKGNQSPSIPIIEGATWGHKNIAYTYYTVASDPEGDSIKYTFDWDDDTISMSTSSFIASETPFSVDNSWSKAGKYTVKVVADDNISPSISSELVVYIDAVQVGSFGYLTDDDGDGVYDTFHNELLNISADTELLDNGLYLIDYEGDDIGDYEFSTKTGDLLSYPSAVSQYNYIIIIIAVLIISFFVIIMVLSKFKKIRGL